MLIIDLSIIGLGEKYWNLRRTKKNEYDPKSKK